MPGFLGGSSGSSGTGGEITFPKEFIDPVTKLRISQPENLIDTDFEYGLQPTKWETVELINNTPSFFSKSGDTTIPGIVSIATNNGTREITVITATDHGLAVGIPINVTGTKSVTADGSYVINSIPNTLTFTYLCKDEQIGNNAIEDLYSSIITGEFFQGSQIRIADAEGVTTDSEAISTLTVKTDSTHGFGLNTPFYFLNLNSTISQEFEASNTAAKSFDSSNSATAQTFDGSNTLSTFNIDWSNSATVGGTTSSISGVSTVNDTITVAHGAETFASRTLGTPLYYNLTSPASSGYFFDNPRGVVFLKTINALNTPAGSSTFQVSATPDGDAIDIVSSMSGTFQLANQARTFAGNNINTTTQAELTVLSDTAYTWDAANNGTNVTGYGLATIYGYNNSIIQVTTPIAEVLDYYSGTMVRYSTTGSAATNLVNNRTYFVTTAPFQGTVGGGTLNLYQLELRQLPGASQPVITGISGGTGTQTLTRIGIATDKDIVHIRGSNFEVKDMLKYSYPAGQAFGCVDNADEKNYYFVETKYDTHNYTLSSAPNSPLQATGGTVTTQEIGGVNYNVHTFATSAATNFVVSNAGSTGLVEIFAWGAGGGGGGNSGVGRPGGGGAAAYARLALTAGTYVVSVGGPGGGAADGCISGVGAGAAGAGPAGSAGGSGGVPGTSPCSSPGGGGGGGTLFLQSGTVLVAAGGGGGGGGSEANQPGNGNGGGGGQAGTGTSSGFAGGGAGNQGTGTGGTGESPGGSDASAGGGGGGGFRGGGGGQWPRQDGISGGGGGGGSSFVVGTAVNSAIANGSGTTPGDSGNAYRGTAGNPGGACTTGTVGKMVIRFPATA
jgi:hypothetical protein